MCHTMLNCLLRQRLSNSQFSRIMVAIDGSAVPHDELVVTFITMDNTVSGKRNWVCAATEL
jgi:hypothetical protein